MAIICNLLFCTILAVVFTNAIAAFEKTTDYCNLQSCKQSNLRHTMCKYESSAPAKACKSWSNLSLSDAEKNLILRKHNELRQKVASGQETRGNPGPQPPAAYMPNLSWDNELEMIAQRWANQCIFGHDECRNVARFWVGQNVAMTMSSGENNTPVEDMIQMWYDEVNKMDNRQVEKLTNINGVGHYTQLVWGNTVTIGCGRIKYRGQGWNNQLLVCNYGPTGNYLGQKVYEVKK